MSCLDMNFFIILMIILFSNNILRRILYILSISLSIFNIYFILELFMFFRFQVYLILELFMFFSFLSDCTFKQSEIYSMHCIGQRLIYFNFENYKLWLRFSKYILSNSTTKPFKNKKKKQNKTKQKNKKTKQKIPALLDNFIVQLFLHTLRKLYPLKVLLSILSLVFHQLSLSSSFFFLSQPHVQNYSFFFSSNCFVISSNLFTLYLFHWKTIYIYRQFSTFSSVWQYKKKLVNEKLSFVNRKP